MKEEQKAAANIFYVSSVPVTLFSSGATFMHRLFEGSEKRLSILQGIKLQETTQLKNIEYNYYEPVFKNLQYSRFRELYYFINIARYYFLMPQVAKQILKQHDPRVIVTVSNGLLWVLAYRIAKKHKLPLVILIHDDMNAYYSTKKISGKLIHALFKKVYRAADLRFCISELMRDRYVEKFKVPAELLYPLQGKPTISHFKERREHTKLTIAYAGSLDTGIYVDMLTMLAAALKKVQGSLLIFSNTFPHQLANVGNITNSGFLHPEALEKKLKESADVLFVPFPFYDKETNVELAFPSKIADYTLISKPLLIWAPQGCAVSLWFRSLPAPVGVLVESMNQEEIEWAVEHLSLNVDNKRWGYNSYETGQEYFGNKTQKDFFLRKLSGVIN